MSPGCALTQRIYLRSFWQVPFGSATPLGFGSRWLWTSVTAAACSDAHRASASRWASFSSRIIFCCSWSFFFCFLISCCWKTWRLWKWPRQMGSAFWLVPSFSLPGCWEGSVSRVLCSLLSAIFWEPAWREFCRWSFVLPCRGLGIQPLLSMRGFSRKEDLAVTWGRRNVTQSSHIKDCTAKIQHLPNHCSFDQGYNCPAPPLQPPCSPSHPVHQAWPCEPLLAYTLLLLESREVTAVWTIHGSGHLQKEKVSLYKCLICTVHL